MAVRSPNPKPLFVTTRGASAALGVGIETIRAWIAIGALQAIRPPSRPPWYERQLLGSKGVWRVSVDSIEALLASLYAGGVVPAGIRRRLRSLGKPAP